MSGESTNVNPGGAMNKKRSAAAWLCTALLALSPAAGQPAPDDARAEGGVPASANGIEDNGNRISNVFIDTDLREVLQDIAAQAQVIIIPDPTVEGLVTAELNEVTLEQALDIVLAGTGLSVMKAKKYYLVYSPDPRGSAFNEISQTRLVRLQYALAQDAQRLLSPNLQPYGRADERSHTLLVTAPESLLERILADIAVIDQTPRHVMLDVRVVVMERTDLLNLGVTWDFPAVRAGAFTNSTEGTNWPWGLQIGYTPAREFTASLNLALNLLEQNLEASIVASPQVMAQDGKPAQVAVTTEEYFQIATTGVFTTAQLQQIESGTSLQITPRIGTDDKVTLQIQVEVSDVVSRGENNLPIVTRRQATNTVTIQSGGTAVLAGLMDSRTDTTWRSVPGASRAPLVGRLFENEGARASSRQIAVLVTASLLDDTAGPQNWRSERVVIPPVDTELFRAALRESLKRIP